MLIRYLCGQPSFLTSYLPSRTHQIKSFKLQFYKAPIFRDCALTHGSFLWFESCVIVRNIATYNYHFILRDLNYQNKKVKR